MSISDLILNQKGGDNGSLTLLWWDRNGFWLCYKRLERGKLKFPNIVDDSMLLTADQFGWLLSGLDFVKHDLLPEVTATNFY